MQQLGFSLASASLPLCIQLHSYWMGLNRGNAPWLLQFSVCSLLMMIISTQTICFMISLPRNAIHTTRTLTNQPDSSEDDASEDDSSTKDTPETTATGAVGPAKVV